MGTKYSTQSRTGYNASPPSDDGAVNAANQVTWAKHKTKLSDPIADQIDSMNTALNDHFNEGPDTKSANYTTVAGDYKKILNVSAGITISLSSVAAVFNGYRVYIKNSHSVSITVNLANAADSLDGTTNGSATLQPQEAREFVVLTTGQYISLDQTINLVDLTGAQSISGAKTFSDLTATGAVDFSSSTLSLPASSVGQDELEAGAVVQVVNFQTGAVATGTTTIPDDDTIPQNTEGDEYMTLAITPKSTTNKLKIEVVLGGGSLSSTNAVVTMALFKDSDTDAIAASYLPKEATANRRVAGGLTHYMTAGSVSEITFKVRIGRASTGTFTFNGSSGARRFGGVMASSITITEIKA